jgi:EAL domain-containing protein (putative c-di-GMP-specific phosphodiesterase class I)
VEALLRWKHPERGLLLPGEFLYLAEMCGIMDTLNRWALETACRQAQRWQAGDFPGLGVATNLSAPLFQHPALVADVRRILKETDLSPESLTLEITETTAMQNAEISLSVLRDLKSLGVHIAIDDFGTGYSSLSYLRTFPIDILKIDRTFVQDIRSGEEDNGIAGAVISLARGMGMRVVAEGVETDEQLESLRSRGCDEFQGFLFSRALPVPEIESLLATHVPPSPRRARSA